MEEVLLPLLPEHWRQEIRYYTEDEFSKVIIDEKMLTVSSEKISEYYNEDVFHL